MNLVILNSGSKANGYILHNEKEALIIECGCTYRQCLEALDFRREKIVGALISHEHGDHAKYVKQYIDASVPVLASQGTVRHLNISGARAIESRRKLKIGDYLVMPFDVEHDAAEPFGYLIYHHEFGLCLFATDTYFLRYKFTGLSQILIECNYDRGIIEQNVQNGVIPNFVKDRVLRSHMSLDTTISTLKANDLSGVENVVLLHLSSQNSDEDLFKTRIETEVGIQVKIAKKGMQISLNKK